ncbi:hypothetical protein GGI15_003691 [Coemansia interrupta]|uniref:Uncharacterized protein n=1 Tax=Coemansia interrupta TaxID=1126814 RepID=A0A9W8LGX3_9FUNG|nr:hypothetical protein GGI15_003691 [Coemansia interrupta]
MRRERRTRHAHSVSDFGQLSGAAQVAHLEQLVSDVRAATYAAISAHTGHSQPTESPADPLDAVATANAKYEVAQQHRADFAPQLDAVGGGLRSLVRLAKAHANLRDSDEQLASGDLAAAAGLVSEAQVLLAELSEEEEEPSGSAAAAADMLRCVAVQRRAGLRAELEYVGAEMYMVEGAHVEVRYAVERAADGAPYESAVAAGDLFFALGELGLATALADRLADGLAALVGRFSAAATCSAAERTEDPLELARDKCASVVAFVRDDVFREMDADEHGGVVAYVGARMWRVVAPAMRELVGRQQQDAGRDLAALVDAEDAWVDAGLIAAEDACVRAAVRDQAYGRAAGRRADLLANVAELLGAAGANTAAVGEPMADAAKGKPKAKGGGSPLAQPACKVSVRAQALVDFAHATVALPAADDASANVTVAQQYLAVRDALALYRAVLEASVEAHVADRRGALQAAADSAYVARGLSTLCVAERERWAREERWVGRVAGFTDAVMAYRALGRRALTAAVEAAGRDVHRMLQAPWDAGGVAAACAVVLRWAEDAACLPDDLRLRALGRLVAALLGRVRRRVAAAAMAAGDAEARAVRWAVAPVLRLPECFVYAHPAPAVSRGARAPVAKYCGEWDDFLALVGRLDAISSGISE